MKRIINVLMIAAIAMAFDLANSADAALHDRGGLVYDDDLDITWLKDKSLEDPDSLPEPHILAADAITELNACVDELQEILDYIDSENEE